jgi:uncharacterized protein
MPINAHPEYFTAEKRYLEAQTDEERILALEDLIRKSPNHKGAENLRAQLRLRLKKLKEQFAKAKKSGKSNLGTIRKGDMQVVLVGFTNSGKSSILSKLTNAQPNISNYKFTTTKPEIGTLKYQDVDIQVIDLPSIGSENFNLGLVNSADLILITITTFEEIQEILNQIPKAQGKKIIIFNKSDLLTENEQRKINAKLKSNKYEFILTSTISNQGIEELKQKIFEKFPLIRIYLKEPGKPEGHRPIIIKPNSTIQDLANKISKQFAKTIKEVHIWGPSSKFPNQKVGLTHKLKDKDIVEFKTR